jgi:Kef-type K+ transport system membrane component KefB
LVEFFLAVFLVVAVASKLSGGYAGAKLARFPPRDSLTAGS